MQHMWQVELNICFCRQKCRQNKTDTSDDIWSLAAEQIQIFQTGNESEFKNTLQRPHPNLCEIHENLGLKKGLSVIDLILKWLAHL